MTTENPLQFFQTIVSQFELLHETLIFKFLEEGSNEEEALSKTVSAMNAFDENKKFQTSSQLILLKALINDRKNTLISTIQTKLLSLNDEVSIDFYLSTIFKFLRHCKSKYVPLSQTYLFFTLILLAIEEVEKEFSSYFAAEKSNQVLNNSSIDSSSNPLIWNTELISLCTLLYELREVRKTKNGKPYLEGNNNQIFYFLQRNFKFSNLGEGSQLSKASVNTYMDPLQTHKKAKRNKVSTQSI